jgi:hypothetical protein
MSSTSFVLGVRHRFEARGVLPIQQEANAGPTQPVGKKRQIIDFMTLIAC